MKKFQKIETSSGLQYIGNANANEIVVATTNFNNNFTTSDANLQTILEKIDEYPISNINNLDYTIEYLNIDNLWYNTNQFIDRIFPINSNLEIGKTYLMNYYFLIYPGGTYNDSYGMSYLYALDKSSTWHKIEDDSYLYYVRNIFKSCLATMPCINFGFSVTTRFRGSKIIFATNEGSVGKVKLRFNVKLPYPQWRIEEGFIEFIKINNV